MISAIVECLECPHCGGGLAIEGRSLRCPNGHVFDIAHEGYVNLLPGDARPGTADTAEMARARTAFLAAGHYARLAGRVSEAIAVASGKTPGCVVEAGAGTGYYLAAALDRLPGRAGLALDNSKHALQRAARAHERIGAVVCDVWGKLPVRTGSAASILNVFAPRNGGEFRRILHPQGGLVVVTPTRRHLAELVASLGLLSVDARKPERLAAELDGLFEEREAAELEWPMRLSRKEIAWVAAMGPSAWHKGRRAVEERLEAVAAPMSVTGSVTISTYRAV